MDRLTPKNFFGEVAREQYSVVVFSSLDCLPCSLLKESIGHLIDIPEAIRFYEYQAKQLGSEDIVNSCRIGIIPRTVVFYKGQEVGRFLGYRSPPEILSLLESLMINGKLLSEENDAEEVSYFYQKVMEALDWNFRRDFAREEWETKGQYLMELAHKLISKDKEWSTRTIAQLKGIINEENHK